MTADFDVVVVAYENRTTIASCIEHARRLTGVDEIVVVDHDRDSTRAVARDFDARVLRDSTNPGFGAGQNRGIAATTAPFALLLNPDAAPDDLGTRAGLRALRANPEVGAVQGMITDRATGRPERSRGRELGPVHLIGRAVGARRLLRCTLVQTLSRRVGVLADHVDRVPATAETVASLAATAIMVRRAAFDSVGGFDESYFLYGEDLDLCRRMRVAGWTLLALPERAAWHEGGGSAASTVARELAWWRGTMRFSALWWSSSAWFIALFASAVQWCRLTARRPMVARRAWRALLAEPLQDRKFRDRV